MQLWNVPSCQEREWTVTSTEPEEAREALRTAREARERLLTAHLRQRGTRRAVTVLAAGLLLNAAFLAAPDLPAAWRWSVQIGALGVLVGALVAMGLSRKVAGRFGESVRLRARGLPRRYLFVPLLLGLTYGAMGPLVGRWADSTGVQYPHALLALVMTILLTIEMLAAALLLRTVRSR
jgi:hypothetical protein